MAIERGARCTLPASFTAIVATRSIAATSRPGGSEGDDDIAVDIRSEETQRRCIVIGCRRPAAPSTSIAVATRLESDSIALVFPL